MRYLICIFVFTAVVSAEIEYGGFEFDGYEREYIVFLPENYEPGLPMVFNLHGDGMTAQGMMNLTRMNEVADTANFVLVYPNSADTGPTSVLWNSGITEFGDGPPDVDDVGFLSTLIDTIYDHYAIDTNRVYACGVSGGAVMILRLAAELSDRINKVAPILGVTIPTIVQACSTASPISALFMNGTEDPYYDMYEDGESWFSVMRSVQYWAEFNQCNPPIDSLLLPDIDQNDDFTVTVFSYRDGVNDTEVIFYRLEEAGHVWPGMPYFFPTHPHGDINASEVIWNFFNSDNYEINGVWAHDLWRDTSFVEPGAGTLSIGAAITNTDDHSYAAYAVVFDANSSVIDSVELFDDGEHDDGVAGDGIAGAFLTDIETESFFFVQASTVDMETGDYLGPHDYVSFTTVGPLFQVGYQPVNDAYPNPGDFYRFHLDIQNPSDSITVPNVSVQLRTIDSLVVGIDTRKVVGNLAPGQVDDARYLVVDIAEFEPTDTLSLPVEVDIYSNNTLYWVDTLWLTISPVGLDEGSNKWPSEYVLIQNYPNPFNPTTTISYDLPEQSSVNLTVYNIRGEEIMTLQNTDKSPGNYEVQWNGMAQSGRQVSTGVYLCRFTAGNFSHTIKMVYLR